MPRFSLDEVPSDDEDEVEPSHPIGFAPPSPWGKTWFSLDEPSPAQYSAGRSRYSLDDDWSDDDDDDAEEKKENEVTETRRSALYVQSYPPLSAYIDSENLSTAALLAADRQDRKDRRPIRPPLKNHDDDDDEDELNYSADDDDDDVALLFHKQKNRQFPKLPRAMQEALIYPSPSQQRETEKNIQRRIQAERRRIDEECRRNAQILEELVLKNEKDASTILRKRQVEEEKRQKQLAEQQKRDQKSRDEQAAKEQRNRDKQDEIDRINRADADASRKKKEKETEKARKKVEHVEKAKKLVGQLVQVRASIEPFDQNKAVSKRRLGMKKIARGKVNTLSENSQKVQEVATDISQAISNARQEDEQIKQGLQRGESGLTPDMARGKRYFLDLLASNAMTRVQAESFNGVKGDGFPLAAMLSMVTVENKDLTPIFAAHVYTVCPCAIPILPSPKHDATEDEVMTGLGMQKNKNGEYESFPQFLSRTENLISFMADIQASLPSSHPLMGGNQGAVLWLKRFLDLLPPPPTSPLPLITAPVLGAFLIGAGHMLANKHTEVFKESLSVIADDIVNRLDEGEIGTPSAIRLKKVLDGGFERFQKNLPPKAIPELYYGASEASQKTVEYTSFGGTIGGEEERAGSHPQPGSNPFGSSSNNNPFGGGGPPAPNPFATASNSGTTASPTISTSSFGKSFSSNNMGTVSSSPFGQSGEAPSQSPFFSNSPAHAFAQMPGQSNFSSAPSPSPFTSNSPFGQPKGQSGFNPAPSLSPFTSNAPSPAFGKPTQGGLSSNPSPSPSSFTSSSPFGQPRGQGGGMTAAPSPSPFTSSSPFGQESSQGSFKSPFQSPAPQSSFGTSTTSSSAVGASPFGSTGGSNPSPATPFGSNSGGGFQTPSLSPFGVPNTQTNPSLFGSSFGSSTAPALGFGTSSSTSTGSSFGLGFGGNSNQQQQVIGGGDAQKKMPCKYFASGNCRFGSNCRFSHEIGGSGGTPFGSQGGFGSNPFGGPRR